MYILQYNNHALLIYIIKQDIRIYFKFGDGDGPRMDQTSVE